MVTSAEDAGRCPEGWQHLGTEELGAGGGEAGGLLGRYQGAGCIVTVEIGPVGEVGPVGRRTAVRRITVDSTDPESPGVTAQSLRQIPVARLATHTMHAPLFHGRSTRTPSGPLSQPRGGPGKDAAFYASQARLYVELLEAGFANPVEVLAERQGAKVGTIQSRLRKARQLGLLTMPGRGVRGRSTLTEKGRKLIEQSEGTVNGKHSEA